jgi:hypothetical protein
MVDYKCSQKVWLGKAVMDITQIKEIKERLAEIGERLAEIRQEQSQSGLELAKAQGTSVVLGISVDPLTDWARKMRELNTEWLALIVERTNLKERKRALVLEDCTCDCHA